MKAIIIGAGVAGLSIGWRLLQRGAQVTILERGQPGHGASWAAAGMIAPVGEMAGAPPAEIEMALGSAALWPGFAAALEQASGLPIGYRAEGALLVADDPDALQARAAADPGLQLLTPAEAALRAPLLTGAMAGALWAPNEARVDNRALTRALAVAFERAGGKLVTNEAVVAIGPGRVQTPFDIYEGDAVLVAAGAWSGQVTPAAPLTPVKGQMIALASPDGAAVGGPVIWGHGVYAVPRGAVLLVGATVETIGFDTSLDPNAAKMLRARATRLMPGLQDWTLADHWAGLRPRSPDGLPLLGPATMPTLFVAGGQYRNGILFAPAIAELMADMMLGRADVIAAFDPRRFA